MAGLDKFMDSVSTTDTKKKISVGQDICNYLGDPESSIECEDMGAFIDAMVPWMQSSNFKVSQNGLDIVGFLIDRLASDFRPYLNTILSTVVDRLGDTREVVREKANIALCKLMDATISPQPLFEKISGAFSHKNGKVREEVMLLLQNTLNAHGAQSLTVSKLIPSIVTSLADPMASVRDAAVSTLVEIYRHVGERVRMDLQKKQNIPSNKLAMIMSKFDEVRTSGNMMPTATLAVGTTEGRGGDDETDRTTKSAKNPRSSSVPANRERRGFATPKPPTADGRGSAVRRQTSIRYGSATGGQAGAVDEESFIQAFEDVKKVTIFSGRGLDDELTKITATLSSNPNDWKQRMEALQLLRSFIVAGAGQFDELIPHLKTLEYPFESCVKDLRSQIVRDCCITLSYMCQELHHKVDRLIEFLLPSLLNLIQNSAKVMATSGIVCIRFIIQNTYSPRFLPPICQSISSKSKEIRRQVCEFLDQLLHTWPTHSLEKHIAILQEAIKKGISDADSEARTSARKAYWGFADHFKDQADSLLSSLDPTYKRLLQGEMSNSSSSNSLNTAGGLRTAAVPPAATTTTASRSRQSSVTGSNENLLEGGRIVHGSATLGRKSSGIPKWTSPSKTDASLSNGSPHHTPPGRSNSAIDATAARRASVRQQYSQRNRMGLTSARPRKSSEAGPGLPPGPLSGTPDRSGRARSRTGGVSQSQPGSRSASPSSIKSYHTYFDTPPTPSYSSNTVGRASQRKRSGIPMSTGTSREASPQRYTPSRPGRTVGRPPIKPVMTEKILKQSREAESALADALKSPRKRSTGEGRAFEGLDGSDESETSSLCSEKSFDYSRGRPTDDISEIIANCASTHWADRKDGLIGLQSYFRDGRMLSASELKRVTDIFTKMFMDAHTKVFSLFLETMGELVTSHKADLYDWLYVLLTRLLNKLGADLLGSVIQKINRTLDVVRESFRYEEQLLVVMKFLCDQTQTPNSKVKLATLAYMRSLVTLVESPDIPINKESEMALAKIITWTSEPKSPDIRRSAHQTLVSMFNTHTPQMTQILQKLPKVYQDNAAELVEKHLPPGESPLKPSSGPSPMKPRSLHSPNTIGRNGGRPPATRVSLGDPDDSENLNPDEVNKSLRLTANAIQNYSFDTAKGDKKKSQEMLTGVELPDEKDSGISQVSAEGIVHNTGLEEKLASLEIGDNSGRVSSNGSRMAGTRPPAAMDDMLYGNNGDNATRGGGVQSSFNSGEDKAAVQEIITCLQEVKNNAMGAERRACMTKLIRLTRSAPAALQDNFRTVLRVVLENLDDDDGSTRALVFGVLTEMLKQDALQPGFHGFTELVILKVLQAHKDKEKDVVRAAESCAATMAGVLPPDMVVRVLNPIIKTGDFPVNQAAIKMLTKLVERQPKETMMLHIAEIMPGLLKAYDNVESSVRKAAVFCMVALHQLVGDEALQPHLDCLNGSKMKLLSLYIKRAEAQSTPASPRLTPP